MSRTIKSVIAAFALVACIGSAAVAGEYCSSTNFAQDVQNYFATADTLSAPPADAPAKAESEKYLTLGELDLSTIRNVMRRTAPMPSGLPTSDDAPAAAPAAVTYVEPPVAAPVVSYPVVYAAPTYVAAPMVSSSTNSNCAPCRNR